MLRETKKVLQETIKDLFSQFLAFSVFTCAFATETFRQNPAVGKSDASVTHFDYKWIVCLLSRPVALPFPQQN